tara:strand:- start:2419 stop:4386 length:1968 start_codon:yes stop_codon:yes gene_type:complete
MCGITGFCYNSKNLKDPILKICQMLDLINHRGPDKSKVFCSNLYCSGTARLEIENIKEGSQPYFDKEEKIIINFNGEIFNYKKLIKKFFPNKNINTEILLLLELFKKKGIEFINEIEGQFAISVFDIKENKLYLFRDRFGIRPLFYKYTKKDFVFSSEIKSIFAFYNQSVDTSFQSILNTSMLWTNYDTLTAFDDIHQLEPGSYLVYQNGKILKNKYWKNSLYKFNENEESFKDISKNFLIEELEKALNRQIHGEVGFASYLSGGIDSSIIALLLTKITKEKIDTFSVEFENNEYDESNSQKQVAKFINSNHRSIKINKNDIANNFEKTINHTETHLFRTAPVPMYLLSKLVKESGHKVVFTGEGADEILLGYDIFAENRIRRFWSKNKNSKIRPQLLKKLYNYLPQFKNSRYFEIIKDFYLKNLDDTKNIFYSHLVRWDQFQSINTFFNKDKIEDHYSKVINNFNKIYSEKFEILSFDRRAQILEIETLLSNYLLSSQGDRMSMANGVEGRYPYLDDDFCFTLSQIQSKKKLSNLKLKNLLRNSFSQLLPKEITERPKIAYQAPEATAFFSENGNHPIIDEFMDDLSENDNFNNDAFENLINKLKDVNINQRLGFRENTAFIIALSDFCLRKNSKKWIQLPKKDYDIDIQKYNI